MAHEVPPLPYDYTALEPHIDEQTMRIHHDKHHAAYVTNLNAALDKAPEWLKADGVTLGGTPTSAGSFQVELTLTLEREARKLDGNVLSWGNEKVVSQGMEKVGTATQKFTIVVEK